MAKYIKLLVGPVLAGAFLATGYIAARAAESNVAVMAPVKGVSFDVGSKRAVTYYKPAGGICNLTLLLAERAGDDVVPASASRVTVPVLPGKSARFDTAETTTGAALAPFFMPGARGKLRRRREAHHSTLEEAAAIRAS